MNKTYQKTFPGGKNAGFTLIELLVVVLIIGILAAVALPQYQKAVIKSRVNRLLPWFQALKHGKDLYLLNGGRNICMNLQEFADAAGIEYESAVFTGDNNACNYSLTISADLKFNSVNGGVRTTSFNDTTASSDFFINMVLSPMVAAGMGIEVGTIYCMPNTDRGKEMCQAITGKPEENCIYGSRRTACYRFSS